MRFWITFIFSLLAVNPSFAASYVYNYSADYKFGEADDVTVYSIADEASTFATITGTITFSDNVISTSGSEVHYTPAILTFNELTTPLDIPSTSLRIKTDPTYDELVIIRNVVLAENTNYNSVGLILRDEDNTALDAPNYPGALDISLFEANQLYFMNQRDNGSGLFASERINFEITSLQLSVVPLPAALPLYGAGIAIMGFIGWHRKRKAAL